MPAAGAQEPVSSGLYYHHFEIFPVYAIRTPDVFRLSESRPFEQASTLSSRQRSISRLRLLSYLKPRAWANLLELPDTAHEYAGLGSSS